MGTVDRRKGHSLDISAKILQELQALNGRITKIEDKVNNQEQAASKATSPVKGQVASKTNDPETDLVIPTMEALK